DKRRLDIGYGRAAHFNTRIAPRIDSARRVASPHATHAQTGDECDATIDGDRLPMISAYPAKWPVEPGRVVAAHVDAAGAQPVPESRRRLAEPSQPVVQQSHLNAGSGRPK